jgi:hypothetical protein
MCDADFVDAAFFAFVYITLVEPPRVSWRP